MSKQLENIKLLAKKAHQGEWHSTGVNIMAQADGGMDLVASIAPCNGKGHCNAEYIEAVQPSAILNLITRLERAEAKLSVLDVLAGHDGDVQ